ncbi:MAG: IS30 family transposase, partial [Candidatus Hydrogenedentota bacterium]
MPYQHLTPEERGQMEAYHKQNVSNGEIARRLGRHPSTIGRELKRDNAARRGYRAARAQKRYTQVRQACRRTTSLSYAPLRAYVFERMTVEQCSPEQISMRLWLDYPGEPRMRVSHETIYRSLYADERLGRPLIPYLRQRRPRRRKRGQRKPTRPRIPNRVGIEHRPPEAAASTVHGHWEADLIVGAGQKGAVLTLVEKKSLYLCAVPLASKNAEDTAQAIIQALR